MRLLILEDESEMGGVQHSTLNLLRGLVAHYPEVEYLLLLPQEGPLSAACRSAGYHFQFYPKLALHSSSATYFNDRLRLPNLAGLWKNRVILKQQLAELQPLVAAFAPQMVLTKGMGAHLKGGRVCKALGIPCVWHLQDHISPRYGRLYQRIFARWVKRYTVGSIADGGPIKALLHPKEQARCALIFNGVPLEDFYQPEQRKASRAALGLSDSAYVIGHLARLGPWKGQHHLLKAFARYASQNYNAHLIFIGSPLFKAASYEDYLKEQTARFGLQERVHFLGYRTDLGFVLSALDVFMYPSVEKDTSPLALVSAMAAGLPMGVSDIEGLNEMVAGNQGARLFSNKNQAEMHEIITYFAATDKRLENGAASLAYARQHFSIAAYTKACIEHLHKFVP